MMEFSIQSFSSDQQKQLAEKWLCDRATHFIEAFARFGNGELGGTPLLLTIAAIVYSESGRLPARRTELYRQFVYYTGLEALSRGGREQMGPELLELEPQ